MKWDNVLMCVCHTTSLVVFKTGKMATTPPSQILQGEMKLDKFILKNAVRNFKLLVSSTVRKSRCTAGVTGFWLTWLCHAHLHSLAPFGYTVANFTSICLWNMQMGRGTDISTSAYKTEGDRTLEILRNLPHVSLAELMIILLQDRYYECGVIKGFIFRSCT